MIFGDGSSLPAHRPSSFAREAFSALSLKVHRHRLDLLTMRRAYARVQGMPIGLLAIHRELKEHLSVPIDFGVPAEHGVACDLF